MSRAQLSTARRIFVSAAIFAPIDIQLGRLTPMSEYPCSGASAERPRPRGQSRCQGPAREDAGAPLRRRWLRLLLKHYQRRAKVTAPLRGKSKSSNLCKADHLKLNSMTGFKHILCHIDHTPDSEA